MHTPYSSSCDFYTQENVTLYKSEGYNYTNAAVQGSAMEEQ